MKLPKPTAGELEILDVLWRLAKPATVREVHDVLNAAKPTGYTTVLKLMQIMAGKGLVKRDEQERAHRYTPRLRQEQTQTQLLGDLLDRAFQGSAALLVQQALESKRATKAEIDEIRLMLDRYEEKNGGRK
ncbi:MAG: BlaI/MecI/CopY family transcriptional regulator [Bryobacteraceae bacterium]|nr:BlaI/MecI/CopY family transcriptional regulator [Bryobacteraceae bacterium]